MKEWDALRAVVGKKRKVFDDGLAHTPEALQPLTRAVLAALDAPAPPPRDARLHGAMLALIGPSALYKDPNRFRELAAFHVALGLPFAVEAAVASTAFEHQLAVHLSNYTDELAWIIPSTKGGEALVEPWVGLREAAGKAKPAERQAAIAAALEAGKGAAIGLRAALAWTFPDEPRLWTDEDRRHGLVCDDPPGSLYDLAMLRHVELGVGITQDGYQSVANLPDAEDIAKHLPGEQALPALRHHLLSSSWDADDAVAGIVADIGGATAIAVLAEGAHLEKLVLPRLLAACAKDPKTAAAALADVLARRPRKKRSWERVSLSRPTLETLKAMVLAADPKARAKPTTAAASALPAPLASPPWLANARAPAAAPKAAKKAVAPKPVAPKAVAHPERLDWGKRKPASLFEVDSTQEKKQLARIRTEQKAGDTFFMHTFMWLGDVTAKQLVAELPITTWYGGIDDVEGMLARFGLEVLDPMLAYVKRQPDRFGALLAVDSPRIAMLAAHLFATSKKNSEVAEQWLAKFPRAAAVGLVAALAKESGKAKESIERALAFVRSKDPKTVAAVLAAAGATSLVEEAAKVARTKPVKAPKLPPFVNLDQVLRPTLKDGPVLDESATRDLIGLLVISDRRTPLAELATVARELDAASLDRFAWSLFVQWRAAGGPPKHPSGLDAMGWFGSASTLRTLAEGAREWAPGGLPQRAQAVVDVLALAQGMAGLAAIHRLTQVRSRALARHAEKGLVLAAKRRGIAKEDLVDQLVPDLGLDSDGSLTFDLGNQQFTLAFDEKLTPYVLDARGKRLADLPKVDRDEDGAAAAVAEWKEIKKKARDIVREQARRLEVALATERRFSVEHFESSFAKHPLLQHLARRLVWGAYREDALHLAFRIAEDGTWADLDDKVVAPPVDLAIGLVHPLRLADDVVERWGDRLADYAIIQPFEQLSRTVHTSPAAQKKATSFPDVAGKVVPTGRILGLDRVGWLREAAEQGGRVHAWRKRARGLSALLTLEPGVYLGAPLDDPEQTLQSLVVVADDADVDAADALALGTLDPVFYSELVRDLSLLAL